jgi:hypothetical protein
MSLAVATRKRRRTCADAKSLFGASVERRRLLAAAALEEPRSRHLVDSETRLLLQFAAERACAAAADVAALKPRRRGPDTPARSGYRVLLRVNTEAGTVLTASGADAGITIEQVSEVIRRRFS